MHEISIGPCQRFAYFLGNFGFAHAIVATCDDDDGLATFFATKHDGLGDLRNRASDCSGCLGAGARWLVKLDDAGVDTCVAQKLRSAQGSGMSSRFHRRPQRRNVQR